MIALLALFLFGSGFAALVYQVIWVRLLGLVFGVTVYAASAVLASFMGGLALGSFIAGRLSDRVRSPLRWFAAAEAVIGLSALATPTVLAWMTPLYRQISAGRADEAGVLTLARLACSAAILLVPTTMMGATVPFVLRRALSGSHEVGRRAALRDDGLMLQWIGHRPESQYRLIARTFLEVFPHATAWQGGTLLAGTLQPMKLVAGNYRSRLSDPRFTGALGSVGIAGWGGLVRQYSAGPGELRTFIGPGPILTDDRPLVEYFLSLPRNEPDIDLSTLRGDVRRHIVE